MDLRLHDPGIATQFLGTIGRLFGTVGKSAPGDGYTKAGQKILGLILMNILGCGPFFVPSSAGRSFHSLGFRR